MLTLIPFTTAHFPRRASWFFSEADVVQWAGPAVSYPLNDRCFKAMLDEGLSAPPTRLCWMAESSGDLVGHVQLGFDWRNGNALLSRVANLRLQAFMVMLELQPGIWMSGKIVEIAADLGQASASLIRFGRA